MAVVANLLTTAGLAPLVKTIYDKQMMFREKQELVFEQLLTTKTAPQNMGAALEFQAYRPLATVTSKLTSGSVTSHSAYTLSSRKVQVTPEPWGGVIELAKEFDLQKWDAGLAEQVDIVSDQRHRSIDAQLAIEVGQNGIYAVRADQDATYQATVRGRAGTNTTSVFYVNASDDTNLSTAFVAGSIVTVINGTNYGYTGRVSAISTKGAGAKVTLKTADPNYIAQVAFDATSLFRFVGTTGLVATDVLTTTGVRAARRALRRNRAPYFNGKVWVATVSPEQEYDFMGDTTWLAAKEYSDVTDLYTGEMGEWMGVRFIGTTAPYREVLAGTTDLDAGGIIHCMFFGSNAACNAKYSGGGQGIIVLGGPDKSDKLNMITTVGWKSIFKPHCLTSPHVVSVLTGATDVAMA